jgi:hypothetical protein
MKFMGPCSSATRSPAAQFDRTAFPPRFPPLDRDGWQVAIGKLYCARRARWAGYWITSSARASTEGGIVRPRAFAVLTLITNSNLVGCSTGRSAGFAPLKSLSTK